MLTKSILGVTAAAFIAAASLGASTSTASAAGGIYFGGPGLYIGVGPSWGWGPQPYAQQICKPVAQKVKWYDKKGKKHWSTQVVQKCWWPGEYYPY